MPPRSHTRSSNRPSLHVISERSILKQLRDSEEYLAVPLELLAAFSYVIYGVANPVRPKYCPYTLYCGLLGTQTLSTEPGFNDSSLAKLHGFWTVLYNFITAKRTEAEFIAMIKELSTCSCDVENCHSPMAKILHKEVRTWKQKKEYEDSLMGNPFSLHNNRSDTWEFVHSISKCLTTILSTAKAVSVTKGVSKRWPAQATDLLPLGSDQMVKSLIQWHRYAGDLYALELFPAIIKLCGPLVYDSISRLDAMNILVLHPTKQQLDKVLDILEEEIVAESPTSQLKNYEFDQLVNSLRECLREVCRPPVKSNLLMLNGGGETKALQLCSIILYLIPFVVPRSSRDVNYFLFLAQHISHYGGLVFCYFNMHLLGRPDIPLHPSIVADADRHNSGKLSVQTHLDWGFPMDSHDYIASAMVECRYTKSCAGPDCLLTFKEKSAQFKICAGCSTVGYCSRECQIRHWNAPNDESHKQECKIIARVLKERGGWLESTNNEKSGLTAMKDLADVIVKMKEEGKLVGDDLYCLTSWANKLSSGSVNDTCQTPDWHPGYDDYEEILARLMAVGGPEPKTVNRVIPAIAAGDADYVDLVMAAEMKKMCIGPYASDVSFVEEVE